MSKWPMAPLGSLLTKSEDWITPEPDEQYSEVTVRLWGKGVVLRGKVTGLKLAGNRRVRVRANQFILSRIDARNGAAGLVPDSLDGAVVTNDYPVYSLNNERVFPSFLNWMSKTAGFVELCKRASEGTTNRVRLKEDRFLSTAIPLPPLPEQRRIVARIESYAAKIEEAHSFRTQAVREAEAILPSCLHQIFEAKAAGWATLSMSNAIAMNDRQVDPKLPEYSRLPHISGENMESKTCRLLPYRTAEQDGVRSGNYLFSEGTILYSKIRPYLQKAVLVNFEGLCSADVYPIKVTSLNLEPRFVMWSLVASPFTDYANRLSGRTRMPKLNRRQLLAFPFTYPPLPEQHRIVAHLDGLQAKVDTMKKLQAETADELAALLPSILDQAFKGDL